MNARHKPRGLNKMIHDEWNVILSVERSFEYVDSTPKEPTVRPSVDSSPEISWRNLAWRFSRNKYIHTRTRARVCVRAPTHNYRATIIILPFHAFWLGRHHMMSNRDIRISILIHSPRWPFARFDASYMELFLSLSLFLYSSIYPSVSLVVYFLLWLPILIISVRVVSISVCKMQDEDYIFCIKHARLKISVDPLMALYIENT